MGVTANGYRISLRDDENVKLDYGGGYITEYTKKTLDCTL